MVENWKQVENLDRKTRVFHTFHRVFNRWKTKNRLYPAYNPLYSLPPPEGKKAPVYRPGAGPILGAGGAGNRPPQKKLPQMGGSDGNLSHKVIY